MTHLAPGVGHPKVRRVAGLSVIAAVAVLGTPSATAPVADASPASVEAVQGNVTFINNDLPRSVKRGRSVTVKVSWANTTRSTKKVQFRTQFWCYARSGTITTTPQKWTTYRIPQSGRITTTKLWIPSKCLPAIKEWPKVMPFNANFSMQQKISGTTGELHSPVNVVY